MRPAPREEHGAVLAGEPHRTAAMEIDESDDLLVDLADQHHLDDLDRLGVRDAHAAHELRLLPEPLHERADLRTATVHDDRIDADEPQEDDVERELFLEVGLLHRAAAVLDDDGLAGELTDVRQ